MKYYIYGAGKNLEEVLEQIVGFLDIEAILDNDMEKIGTVINDINVISADEFMDTIFEKDNHRVIVSVTNPRARKEIEDGLKSRGLGRNSEYVMASDFCKFYYEQIPGTVTGVMNVPDGFIARKSFDPNSYLITSEDNRIFRVIRSNAVQLTRRVFEKCKIYDLFDNYIVNSWIPKDINGFENEMLIEHEYIQPISFCYEWPPKMYEDYVMFVLEFVEKLTDCGLNLIDAHGLNATFYRGKFIFVDFGAVGEGLIGAIELMEIVNTLVLPLIMMKLGQKDRAYFYLEDHNIVMGIRDIAGYLSNEEHNKLKKIYEKIIYVNSKEKLVGILSELKRFIIEFEGNNKQKGDWEDYQDSEWNRESDKTKWSTKMKNTISMIETVLPRSIIDIAGNQGWYGAYFREKLAFSAIVDTDTTALDKLWERIKNDRISNVIPVHMSICAPSLGRHYDGFVDGKTIKPIRQSGCERYKSELAIALAIVHHMAFREHLSFDEIIDILSVYTNKYLIVEFVDKNDKFIDYFKKDEYEWYTKNAFEDVLSRRYEIIEQRASSPETTRTLYLCKKDKG